jgi:hypothetical protein
MSDATKGGSVPAFRISSHGRLQDWIAVERGFFDDEGLEYELDVRAFENALRTYLQPSATTSASAHTSST